MVFEGKMVGKRLVGTATGPDNTPWFWIGEKAPYANAQQFLVRAQRRIQIDSQSAFTAIVESPRPDVVSISDKSMKNSC
jgi:hypothetical protein